MMQLEIRARWGLVLFGIVSACGDSGRGNDSAGASMGATSSETTSDLPTTTMTSGETATGTGGGQSGTTGVSTTGVSTTGETATGTSDTGMGGSTAVDPSASSGGTTMGVACPADCEPKGGVCIGELCCPDEDRACGDVCCPDGDICSFNTCVTPGAECIDASECADGEYCEYSLGEPAMMGGNMCQGGLTPATGKCLPSPPNCAPGEEPGDPPKCLASCEYVPQPGPFKPTVKFHWDKGTVMMTPIVVQLDDDNCDMIVDERDIPEIVFSTFINGVYQDNGTIRVISIVQDKLVEKWTYNAGAMNPIAPGRELAGGDIDGVPGNEVVACSTTGKTRAFKGDGTPLWTSTFAGGCAFVSIADLDQDGAPEVLVPGAVLDGKTGATKTTLMNGTANTAADLDGDGQLDIVHARGAFNAAGGVMATTGLEGAYPAVADLDLDGQPEIAVIANGGANLPHHLLIWRHDPKMPNGVQIIRPGIDINGVLSPALCAPGSAGNTRGGGPPTIADIYG